MASAKVSASNAEHYNWGTNCEAWYFVRTPELNIIEERMASGTSEIAHHHVHARQFFFVLAGELTMMLEGKDFVLNPGEGLEIAPGELHQAINRGPGAVRFLVTSQPPSHGDRIDHD